MEIVNPDNSELGRFFAYPTVASSSTGNAIDYWIAADGILRRMTDTCMKAFLAFVEAAIERATLPTLSTENYVGDVSTLWSIEGEPESGLMYPIPSILMSREMRKNFYKYFTRGDDEDLWNSTIRAAFNLFFYNKKLEITHNDVIVTVYPFLFSPISFTTGGLTNETISIPSSCATCDMIFSNRSGELPNPWYEGTREYEANSVSAHLLAEELSTMSAPYEETDPSESMDFRDSLSGHLDNIYSTSMSRTYWEKPLDHTLVDGPPWVTPRRCVEAYGLAQLMLAHMRYTVARFGFEYNYDIIHTERHSQWVMFFDDGILRAEQIVFPESEITKYKSKKIHQGRYRSLGVIAIRMYFGISTTISRDSPFAVSESYLQSIDPDWEYGVKARIKVGPSRAGYVVLGDQVEGGGEILCDCSCTNTTSIEDPEVPTFYPHPSLSQYVGEFNVCVADQINDRIYMHDDGEDSRQAPGTRYSISTQSGSPESESEGDDGESASVGLRNTLRAHQDWILDNCGMPVVTIPDDCQIDQNYLRSVGEDTINDLNLVYSIDGEYVTDEGERFFLPIMVEHANGQQLGSFEKYGEDGLNCYGQIPFGPDPEKLFGGKSFVYDELTHSYGNAIVSIGWKWHAMPTE